MVLCGGERNEVVGLGLEVRSTTSGSKSSSESVANGSGRGLHGGWRVGYIDVA